MAQNYGSTVQELPNIKLPSIPSASKGMTNQTGVEQHWTAMEGFRSGYQRQSWSRPARNDVTEKRMAALISNPQSELGKKILREKFNLPAPAASKPRQCGQKDLAGKLFPSKSTPLLTLATKPQRILTKEQRHDPFADPPPITDHDLSQGMMSLVNRGMIPKNVDLTPAFSRGVPVLVNKAAQVYEKSQQYVRQEIQTGPTFVTSVKMNMLQVVAAGNE